MALLLSAYGSFFATSGPASVGQGDEESEGGGGFVLSRGFDGCVWGFGWGYCY